MVAVASPSVAQTRATKAPVEFNIPSQPLHAALSHYVDATGLDALYDTSLAAGRISGDVRGKLAPDEALKRLLSGTGLMAEFVAETTFVLLPQPFNQRAVPPPPSPAHRRYYGLIQARIANALCQSERGHPWNHRFAAVVWVAPDGAVRNARRLGSTGIPAADARIDGALRDVRLDEPPPASFQQPVLLLIVPERPGVTRGCGSVDPSVRPIGSGR